MRRRNWIIRERKSVISYSILYGRAEMQRDDLNENEKGIEKAEGDSAHGRKSTWVRREWLDRVARSRAYHQKVIDRETLGDNVRERREQRERVKVGA